VDLLGERDWGRRTIVLGLEPDVEEISEREAISLEVIVHKWEGLKC
jgi:hypothetical protein